MKRLVYSPKIMAYVNTEKGVLDITDFVVSGNVNRVVNEVSTAEIVIRNPDKQFTTPGDPTFRPMDQITIFGSRYKNRAVQLFTGYLDSTPYLQLFPGTCSLRASCSLKRLLHTYWDAGVPHTIEYLSKFGWIPNPQTGTMFHGQGQQQSSGVTPGDGVTQEEIDAAIITDGNIGNLLFNLMKDIGNWNEKDLFIEKLPPGIIKTASDIVKTFEKDDDETRQELDKFMADLIGDYSPGMGGGGGTSGGGPITITGEGPPAESIVSPEEVGIEMLRAGFPADRQVLAAGMKTMQGESAFGAACRDDGWGLNDYGCCAGYWQIYLSVHNVSMQCANTLQCASAAAFKIWNDAGRTFGPPNPWEAGTDSGPEYLDVAERCIEAWRNHSTNTGAAGDSSRDPGGNQHGGN